MPPTRPSPATWPGSWASRPARCIPAGRTVLPLGGAVQRRRLQGGRAAAAGPRGPLRLGRPAGPRAGVVRPRPGRGPRCRLLRPGAPGQGRADPRRRGPVVLRRPRDRRAGRPGRRAADQGPLRRADGHGGRHRDRRARPRDRPGRRRAGRVPLPGLDDPPRRRRSARSSSAGTPTSSRSSTPLETALEPRRRRPPASPCRSGCTRTSPKSARSSSGARAPATTARWKLEFNVREVARGLTP